MFSQTTVAFSSQKAKGPTERLTEFSRTRLRKFLLTSVEIDELLSHSADLHPVDVKIGLLKKFIFSKFTDPSNQQDADKRRELAKSKYLACEERCRYVNSNLDNHLASSPEMRVIFSIARDLIYKVLGDFKVDHFTKYAEFGPGASTRLKRPFVDRCFKYEGTPHVTSKAYALAAEWFAPLGLTDLVIVNDAKFVTVPKNNTIDRAIEIQPDIVLFQKSLGTVIRRLMKNLPIGDRFKFNLNDQSINQNLARLGSLDGSLATIDLSAASDTIAWVLVARLLPHDWLCALDLVRVPRVNVDGECIELQKFSAMGNGYTWELQSLLFWALTKATCLFYGDTCPTVATYGDDIICPSVLAPEVITTLVFAGFKVNEDKSFTTGYFRESCGKFYYRGYDVTPFYVRSPINTAIELLKVHNRLTEWMYRDGFLYEEFKPLLEALRDHCPAKYNLPVPYGSGDIGFYDCVTRSSFITSHKGSKWRFDSYLARAITEYRSLLTWAGCGTLNKVLNSLRLREYWEPCALDCDSQEQSSADVPFGNQRYSISHRRFSQWENFGPFQKIR